MMIVFLILLWQSIKHKKYLYTSAAILSLAYSLLFPLLVNPPKALWPYMDWIKLSEKIALITLFAYVLFMSFYQAKRGIRSIFPAIICGAICVVRIARAVLFDRFMEIAQYTGAGAYGVSTQHISAFHVITVLISLLLVAMTISMILEVRKQAKT